MPGKLPRGLPLPILNELYKPGYDPELLKLTSQISTEEEQKVIEERVAEVEKRLFSGDIPVPLTREEAAIVEEQVRATRDAIATTRRRISAIRAKIDAQAAPDGQAEVSFEVDLKKKARLRRAVKKAFGTKPETLTYSMYKAALETKRLIEESEASDYASGSWEDE
jgi:hypothetical protein